MNEQVEAILAEVKDWELPKIRYLYSLITSGYDGLEGGDLPRLQPWQWREVLVLAPRLIELSVEQLMDLARELLGVIWEMEGLEWT